jgi:hypothetical protein
MGGWLEEIVSMWDVSVIRFDQSHPRDLRAGTISRESPVSFSTKMRSSRPQHEIATPKLL